MAQMYTNNLCSVVTGSASQKIVLGEDIQYFKDPYHLLTYIHDLKASKGLQTGFFSALNRAWTLYYFQTNGARV